MKSRRTAAVLILLAMFALMMAVRMPGVNHLRAVEFLQLYASGVILGAGIAATVGSFLKREPGGIKP
jgi:hypothetical protein